MNSTVRVVLVRPEQARNVGAAVRAAANFGAESVRLVSVAPDAEWQREMRVASAGGWDVVRVEFDATLDGALKGCVWCTATSARRRRGMPAPETPRNLLDRVATLGGPGAVVFGPEGQGLTREECLRCGALLRIPAEGPIGSLNLAQAVCVVLYEAASRERPTAAGRDAAADEKREAMLARVTHRLRAADALPAAPRDAEAVAQLRQLLERAGSSAGDLALLEGIVARLSR